MLGLRQGQGDAAAGDERDPARRRSICCCSAASAPMCAHRPRPTMRSATAPTIAIRITGGGSALQGDRRGRQSRHDAARPHRGGAARRAAQHRRDRQFGRRQHLRRRGQHQDRAGDADARRPAHARGAQRAARRDDRRGRGARAAQQLSADARALAGAAARARGSRLPAAPDADAGSGAASSIARSSSCPTTWSSPSAGGARRR